jgi:hypothetical protein
MEVILAGISKFTIACTCCERGYEGSPGCIQTYEYTAETSPEVINGIRSQLRDGVLFNEYTFPAYGSAKEEELFSDREEAKVKADEIKLEHEAEEIKRLRYKEKQAKTWAWNVSYHRRAIKEAQRQIEYHTSKLNAAPKNIKELDKKKESL